MTFDQLVNQILKEALVSSIPAVQTKEKEVPVSQPQKKVQDIGQTQQQQQQSEPVTGTPAQTEEPEPQDTQDSSAAVEDLTKQMADTAKKEEERSKKEHDDFAKLIATLTATQRAQQPATTQTTQTPQTPQAPATNIPNMQQIIAGLQNLGK